MKKIKKKEKVKKKSLLDINKSKKSKDKDKVNDKVKKKKTKRKWWKRLLSFCLVCGALGVFAVFAFCIYIVSSCGEFALD